MAPHRDSVPTLPLALLPPGSSVAPQALPHLGITQPSLSQGCSAFSCSGDAEGGNVPKGHRAAKAQEGVRSPGESTALPRNIPHPGEVAEGTLRTACLAVARHHTPWPWPWPGLQPPTPQALWVAPTVQQGSAWPHNLPPPSRAARPRGPRSVVGYTGFLPAAGASAPPGWLAGEEPGRLCNGQ